MSTSAALTARPRSSRAGSSPWAAGIRTANARKLLLGGMVGGHVSLLGTCLVMGLLRGPRSAATAAIAAAVTIVFFAIGQAVQVIVAESDPVKVMVAAMGSYALRATGLGLLLALAMRLPQLSALLDEPALAAGVIVTVLCWLGAEIWTFSRLRIPVWDHEYLPPDERGEGK